MKTVGEGMDKLDRNYRVQEALYHVDIYIQDADIGFFDREDLINIIDEYNEMLKELKVTK